MANKRQLMLGAFLVIVLTILGVYTLFLTDFSLFSERHELIVQFPEANGLRKGDSVLVAGIREGRVKTLAYDPNAPRERRITVSLVLDQALGLREGFDIYIADATVLGGKQVYIDPGPSDGVAVTIEAALQGRVKGGALDGLGQLVEKNGAKLEAILDDLGVMVADVKAGKGTVGKLMRDDDLAQKIEESAQAAKEVFTNVQEFTADIKAGKGLLGKLATDEDLARKFEEVTTNLADVTAELKVLTVDVQAGKGMLGRLVKDEQLGADIAAAVATIKDISARINSSNGTVWKLLEDDALYQELKGISDKLDGSTLGKLLTTDEIYVKLAKIADDLASATTALRTAEGTLGKLVMDKDLYEEARRALNILTRTLEEYREAAPITTFSSILFAGF